MSVNSTSEENTVQDNLPFTDLGRFKMRTGHYHIRHDSQYETGTEALYQLQPGIMLRILDLLIHSDGAGETSVPEQKLILFFKIWGNNKLTVEGVEDVLMPEGSFFVSYSESSYPLLEEGFVNQKYLMVMLVFEPDVLLQPPFDLMVEDLPDCIQRIFSGENYIVEKFSMNMDLLQSLGILLNSETVDSYNRPFIQAKTVELLCLALRDISQQESSRERVHVSTKEQYAVEQARQLLHEHWQNPPAQDELVKLVGLGRSKLTKCFKLTYGCSITDYVMNIRMQHAQQLLTQGRWNVTQVALEVGYEHPNNFVSAFKRRFGITPKAFQTASLVHKPLSSS